MLSTFRFANNTALRRMYKKMEPGASLGLYGTSKTVDQQLSIHDKLANNGLRQRIQILGADYRMGRKFDRHHVGIRRIAATFRHDKWREVFGEQLSTTLFSIQSADPLFSLPLGENSEEFTYWLTLEAVRRRFHSLSQIPVLEG